MKKLMVAKVVEEIFGHLVIFYIENKPFNSIDFL